jgi:hypothetical protein
LRQDFEDGLAFLVSRCAPQALIKGHTKSTKQAKLTKGALPAS